jgi:hypothetical protein
MSVTIKLKAGVTCVWGTSELANTSYGVLKSARRATSTKTMEMPDENGEAAAVTIFDQRDELTLSVYCKSSVAPPAIGAALTADGITGTVLSVSKAWEIGGFKMLEIAATKWANIAS